MRKFSLFFGRFFTGVLAVLFVVTLTLVLILYAPSRQLFDPNLYNEAFYDLDIYQKIPAFASHFLPTKILVLDSCADYELNCENTPAGSPLPSFSIKLAPANWQALLEITLPRPEVQSLVGTALDNLFLVLKGNADQVAIPIYMAKGNFTGTPGEQGLTRFFKALPTCTPEETAQLELPLMTRITVPLCKPPDETINLLIPDLLQQLKPYIDNKLPDEMKISLPASTQAGIRRGLGLWNWIPLLPVLLLLCVIWLGGRSIKSRLRLGGILLFISGLLALVLGLIFRFGANAALGLFLGFQNPDIWTPDMVSTLHQLGANLLVRLTDVMIYPTLSLFLIGLLAWISSALIRIKTGQTPSHPTAAPVEGG